MKVNKKEIKKSKVVITLTETEAAALAAILGSVSGWTDNNNPRVATDELWNRLDTAGLAEGNPEYRKFMESIASGAVVV